MWNTLFLATGAMFLLLLMVIFFLKPKLDSKENKLFKFYLIANAIEYAIEIPLQLLVRKLDIDHNLIDILTRMYLMCIFIIFSIFTVYTIYISLNDDKKNKVFNIIKKIFFVYILINAAVLALLSLDKFYDGTKMYAYGLAVDYLKLQLGLYLFIWFGLVIFNFKRLREKKYLPIIIIIVLIIANVLLQNYDPSILIATVVATFISYTMYFTIENPDLTMLQEIEIQKDRAEKANAAKSDFLSSMSHEIRTPLNAIVGFSECINQSETLEEAKENAKDIVGASETLLEIVNGILDISKIESGKIELVENDYNPYRMLEETVKLARGRLAEKPLDFQVNIAQDIPKALYGDKFNIKKILINFLTNAIKYTDEGFVRFDVQCVKLNDMVRLIFSVSDSGRGIKKEDISKLFTKFQRLDEEKNQTIEGTGLGLAITKQLIEMMNGKVVVDSVYGEGSKFTFILDQKISDVELDDTTARIDIVADLRGKKILVVDDNKLNLKVATKLLKTYGVDIVLCNSGPECIGILDDGNKFDLILLDDMMPGMTGIETLAKLKEDPEFNIPTVALTANAINGMKEKYLEAGFDDYLAKPIDKYELNKCLVRFLNPVSSYEADKETTVNVNKEQSNNEVVSNTETNNTVNEVKTTPTAEVVEESKPNDFPQYVPDNTPIVVLPGDLEKGETVIDNEEIEDNNIKNDDSKILLIVDDNNLNIKVESKLITSLGYTVESANSGIEAINMVKNNKYDLIFMDIMMPMMDGVQTLHELKKLDGFDTPVVALTADAVLGAKEKYLSEGFDLYVTKPADKEELREVLDKFNV